MKSKRGNLVFAGDFSAFSLTCKVKVFVLQRLFI